MNSYFPYFEFLKRFLLLIACIVVDVVIVLWSSRDNDVVFIGTTRGPAPGRPGGSNTSKRRRRQGRSECCFLFSCSMSQWSLWHIWKIVVKVIYTSNWSQENLHKCRIVRLKVETWKLQFKMVGVYYALLYSLGAFHQRRSNLGSAEPGSTLIVDLNQVQVMMRCTNVKLRSADVVQLNHDGYTSCTLVRPIWSRLVTSHVLFTLVLMRKSGRK